MGWFFSVAFLIVSAVKGVDGNTALIASGLFAVAGSIGVAAQSLKPKDKQ